MHLASCKAPRWSQAEEAPAGGHCWGQNRTYSHACKCVAPFENLPCMSTCRWDSNNKTLFWAGPRALIQRKLEMLQLLEYPWSRELHTKCHSSLRNIKHSPHSLNQELLCYAYIVIFFFFFWNLKTKKLGQNKSTRLVSATFQSIHLTKKKSLICVVSFVCSMHLTKETSCNQKTLKRHLVYITKRQRISSTNRF